MKPITEPYADKPAGIYRFTSLARPVDPRFPTNRAVLVLLPMFALAGAAIVLLAGQGTASALSAALIFALVAFGAWALARELAPDDNAAAFIAMGFGIAQIFIGADSVLLVFVALFLARLVNRTTGLAPGLPDSVMVLGLSVWAMHSLGQPLLGIVAGLAFTLDALLPGGRRWQLVPAVVACIAAGVGTVQTGLPVTGAIFGSRWSVLVLFLLLAYGLVILRTRCCASVGDIGGQPLVPARVRSAMIVVALVAIQAYVSGGPAMLESSPIWASLAAVPVGALLRVVSRA